MTHYPLEKNISGVVFIGNKGSKLLSTENNFVYDSGNNRLGINTGTPLYTLDVNGTGNFRAIRFPDGSIQSTAGPGSGFSYYSFNLAAGNEASTIISSGQTVSFTGFGNVSISRSGNSIRISGNDANTTYFAGTGLNLIGTTFNISGSTTSNSGIVQLQDSIQDNIINRAVTPNAVFDYVGSVSGGINTRLSTTGNDLLSRINTLSGNLITTGSNLQSQISSVSGLLYNFWTLNVTGSNDQITRQQTVTFTGTGATSVAYNSSTNTVTISSTDTNTTYTANSGIQLVGTTFRTFGTGFFNGINLSGSIGSTTNNLYNSGGQLYFNGYPYAYLPPGGLDGQILYKVSDTGNDLAWIDNYATELRELVKNDTGSGILKGTAVMAVGAVGDRIRVAPAIANGSIEARYMFGITSEDINNGDEGYVTLVGPIKGLVTSGYPVGTVLWLDPNTPGALISGQPSSPNLQMSVAIVTNSHPSNGRIFVRMWEQQPGLHELHDVNVDVNLQHGDLISYNTGNSTWVNIPNFSGILQSQINTVSGLLYNYWTLNVTGANDQITRQQTVTFTGAGATSVTYNNATNTVTITSTDNNTTYSAGTGLNLIGSTFNVSGSTTSSSGIVQLQDSIVDNIINRAVTPNAVFDYVGSVSGAINTRLISTGNDLLSRINTLSGNLITTGANLQSNINTLSGLILSSSGAITSGSPYGLAYFDSGSSLRSSTVTSDIQFKILANSGISFEGSQGQLFSIVNNLSSGVIFNVNDIAGLPLIEADANGYVNLVRYGETVSIGSYAESGSRLTLTPGMASRRGIVISGHPGQTADLFEVINASGNMLFAIMADGSTAVGTGFASARLDVIDTGSNIIPTLRLMNLNANFDPYIRFTPSVTGNSFAVGIDDSDADKFKLSYGPDLGTNDRLIISTGGHVGINNTSPSDTLIVNTLNSSTKGLVVQGSAAQSANLTEWQNSAGSILAHINNVGTIYTSGNIGIGTNVPANRLHIRSSSGTLIRLGITNSNANGVEGGVEWYSNETGVADYFGGLKMRFQDGAASANRQMQFLVSDSSIPKMIIDGGGNVGIGTTSPAYRLDVQSGVINSQSLYRIGGQTAIDIGGDTSNMIFGSSTAGTRTTIRSNAINAITIVSGQVGIGTTVPSTLLEVESNTSGIISISNVNPGSTASPVEGRIQFRGYANIINGEISCDDRQSNQVGGWLKFKTADSGAILRQRIIIDRDGQVGIGEGISAPQYRLDVSGIGNFRSGVRYPDGLTQTIAYTGLNGIATSGFVQQVSGVLDTRLISTGNDLLGRINTLSGNLISTGSNLQSQITSVSGLLYNFWTLNVTGSNDQITRQQTVTFTGTGATSVSYNSTTNTVTINSVDTNTTYTAGTGLNLVGTTFNVSGGTTSNSGILQLQDSIQDNVTNRAVTPNAVFDYVGSVSGVIDSRLIATGNNLQSQINAKDNYLHWTLRADSATTTQVQTTEEVQFTGAGNISVSLGGTDNRRVTISGSTQAVTGPAETIAFFTGNNTLTGSPSLTYDPIKTSFKLITQGDTQSTGFVILNNQNQSGNVFQIRSYIDDVNSTTYNNTYFAGTGDGSYTSNAGFNNTNTIIELLQGSGTFTTGFFPFFITGFVPGKTIIEDGAILTISNAQAFLTGLIEGDLALYTGDSNPTAPTNTGTLATQVTQLSVPIPFTISGSGSNSTTDIDLTALMNQYFNLYPTNTGNILLYYSVYSSTGSVEQQGIGAGNNASTGLRPRLDVSFTTFEYAGTSTNKPIYSVDHVGRIKIGNIERSDQLINSFLLYASGEPNQNANVQIESPNRDARVLFTKNNNKVFSAGTVASDSRFIIKDEINSTTPFQIYPQAKNNGLIVLRNGFIGIKTFNPEYTLHVNGEGWIKALRFYRYTKESEVPRTIRNIYSIKEDLYWNGRKLALGGDFSYAWTVRDGNGNADVVGDGASIYWSGAGNVSTLFSPSSSIMRISGSPGWNLGVGNESTVSVANNANITFTGLDGIRVSRSSNQIRISGASIGPATTSTSGIVQLQDSIVDNVIDRAVTPNAVFDYVGSVSGALNTRIISTGSTLQSQINSVSGLLYNYWRLNVTGSNDQITKEQTVTFTGGGATSVAYNSTTNTITISSTDNNTTYSAGTGLNLIGTTFNISGSTTSNSGIVQLQDSVQNGITNRALTPNAAFTYVGSVSGAIDTRIIATGSNLQSQINSASGDLSNRLVSTGNNLQGQINSVSGLLYNHWTLIAPGAAADNITRQQSVTFTGTGATSVSYNTGTNVLTITSTDTNTTYSAGTGLNLVGTTFNVSGATTSSAGIIQLQDTIQDGITNRATTPNAVFDYVASVSGAIDTRIISTGNNLQGQISANDADIATLSGLINSVSGTTLGTASGVAFFSNAGTITGSPNFTYSSGTATLNINGTLTAISKSFLIDHPTKPDKKLQYSSLESPYHGVRLTGRNRLKNNTCTIQLPEYIYNLVKEEGINIQITNIRHSQIIYVESIDVLNNRFTVACDNADYYHEYEFFWTFTAIRKDIDDLEVEV